VTAELQLRRAIDLPSEDAAVVVREITGREDWNALLLRFPSPDFRQGFEWGQIRARRGARVHRYAAFLDGAPVAAVSAVPWHPVPRGLVLYASRGPVVDPGAGDATGRAVLAIARLIGRRSRGALLRMSPGVRREDSPLHAALTAHGAGALSEEWTSWNAPRITMTLDLTGPEADIKRRMRESTRLALNRAAKHGVKFTDESDDGALARFYGLLVASGRRRGFPVHAIDYFRTLRDAYVTPGEGSLLLATHEGRDLGGLLAVKFGRRGYLLHSCLETDAEDVRKLRVGTGLHWELIRWARARGCDGMDWGGAGTGYPPRPEHYGYGIYDFKHGFGCNVEYLTGYYDVVFRPLTYRLFRLAERHAVGWAWRIRALLN